MCLSKEEGKPCPLTSICAAIAFSSRDWSLNKHDAWIYGITLGWGDAIGYVSIRHGWTPETVDKLNALHRQFVSNINGEG